MTAGSSLRDPAAIVGLAALALALVAVLVPASGTVLAPLVGTLVGVWWPVGVAVAVGIGLVVRSSLRPGSDEQEPPSAQVPAVSIPEHGVTDDATRGAATPGERVDDLVARVDGERVGATGAFSDRSRVRSRIREVALQVFAERGYDEATATRMLDEGTWTDRPRAATFLGGERVALPIRIRVADWASGRGFERTVAETVDALAAVAGVETTDDRDLAGFDAVDRWLDLGRAPDGAARSGAGAAPSDVSDSTTQDRPAPAAPDRPDESPSLAASESSPAISAPGIADAGEGSDSSGDASRERSTESSSEVDRQ